MAGALTWEADVVLRDGAVAHVRPIRPEDAPAVQEMHRGQSAESRYLRFFAPVEDLTERELARFTQVDGTMRVALVVLLAGRIIGIGRFDRLEDDPEVADVAFNVADAHHGRGIGSVLLEHLAAVADELGVRRFRADVLPRNTKMIRVFTDAGYEVGHEFDDGVIAVTLDLAPTARSRSVRAAREHRSEAVSLARVLAPASVVVVGVSRHEPGVGRRFLQNAVAGGYAGTLLALNRAAGPGEEVAGVPLLRGWEDVPAGLRPDLVVLAVPAGSVAEEVRAAGRAGAHAVVIVSTGFAETGPAGAAAQEEVVALAHEHGMRVLGPAAVGLLSTGLDLNLTLSKNPPGRGRLGLFTHSGGVASAILEQTAARGLGVSTFAGAGNRADISGNDLMQYWIDDDDTDVVGLYLQSMGNARKFTRVARALGARKPVLVVRPGHGQPAGHQVRRTIVGPGAADAVLDQAGVITLGSLRELLDVAEVALAGPLPAGPRLGVVANNAGLVSLVTEAAQAHGLTVAAVENVPGEADVARYLVALESALADPATDVVVASFMPPLLVLDADLLAGLAVVVARHGTPCVATLPGIGGARVPGLAVLPMPEDAVAAVAALVRYARWRDSLQTEAPSPVGMDRRAAGALVEQVLAEEPAGRDLSPAELAVLLGAYGIEAAGPGGGEGVALAVASREDPALGPVVSASVAGVATTVFEDVARVVPPASAEDVRRALGRLRARMLLRGGEDVAVDLVARVSALADDLPELAALDLDPVLVSPEGARVVTARARVAPAARRLGAAFAGLD